MRLKSLTIHQVKMPFRFAVRHAAAVRAHNHTIFVRLESEAGIYAWGEAIPRPYLTGETPESVVAALTRFWQEWLAVSDFAGATLEQHLHDRWQAADVQQNLAAFAALDVALRGLIGDGDAKPSDKHIVPRVLALPLLPISSLWPIVAAARIAGYRHFKFKVASEADVMPVAHLSTNLLRGQWVCVDANAAFTSEQARRVANHLYRANVAVFEQPMSPVDLEGVARLAADMPVPLLFDESICSLSQAEAIQSLGGWWNLRIAKNGGVTGVKVLVERARRNGIGVYSGCLVGESKLLDVAQHKLLVGEPRFIAAEFNSSRLLLKHDFSQAAQRAADLPGALQSEVIDRRVLHRNSSSCVR